MGLIFVLGVWALMLANRSSNGQWDWLLITIGLLAIPVATFPWKEVGKWWDRRGR